MVHNLLVGRGRIFDGSYTKIDYAIRLCTNHDSVVHKVTLVNVLNYRKIELRNESFCAKINIPQETE